MDKMTSLTSLITIVAFLPFAVSDISFKPNVTHTIGISPADVPRPGKRFVDATYQSFSIEFSFMADYAGNDSYVHPRCD